MPEHGAATLAAMLQSIAHRGPDDEGVFASAPGSAASAQALLGHRRLAIIDPNGARQPMRDDEAGLVLIFNGEIYNFRELRGELAQCGHTFARDSDTEVLLRGYRQWGDKVVHRLRGQFAFAIWDAPRERLLLARDRFGEKPLFIRETPEGIWFASEIKALLCAPGPKPAVDHSAVWDYLVYRYVPAPRTLLAGIRKLMPGSYALWERGAFTESRYWSPPDRRARAQQAQNGRESAADANGGAGVVDAFLGQLDAAVESQMVSDVPFGAFLSGGLDSSMIVALMTRHCEQVKTFSVGFGDPRYSELPYAAAIAKQFGTAHHELVVSDRDMVALLPKLIAFRDAPVSEPSDIPIHMLACEAAKSVKMVLTGEGSDEILGGYPKHVYESFANGWQQLPGFVRHSVIGPITHALPYEFRRAKTAVSNLNIDDWRERYVRWFGAIDSREREQLSVLGLNGSAYPDAPPFDGDDDNSSLRRMLYFDQSSWLPDNLLERGDRMTMAASIEARVPYLDHRLAEFVSALPDTYRVRGLKTKWILREAGKRVLPEAILKRPKVGFRVPVNLWFRNEMRDYLLDHLQGPGSLTRAYFAAEPLDRMIGDHVEGRQNHEKLLWSLLNLEVWHRHHAAG